MIEKCSSKGLQFKVRDLSSSPFQYQFVVERILEVKPFNAFLTDEHIVEETKLLFAFTKADQEFSRGDLYRLIEQVYKQLGENYRDWVYPESDSHEE